MRGLFAAGVFEDFEDIVYEGFAFIWGEISGVDGLFVGLEISGGGFLREVLVDQANDSVDFLSGESVAAAG